MRAPLVVAVVALAAGIALGLQRSVPSGVGPFLVATALACGLAALAVALSRPGSAPSADARLVVTLLAVAGGLLGLETRTRADRSCLAWLPEATPFSVRGRVEEHHGSGRMRLRVQRARVGGRWRPCAARMPARWEADRPLAAGTALEARGRWWRPPDARSLLGRPGTFLIDSVGIRGPPRLSPGARLRGAGQARIDAVFPTRAPLVASLLLARRGGLDPDLQERFARAGLSHLLAISGLHVGLLAGILLLVARAGRLSHRGAAIAAGTGTVAYVALIGAPDSAVRAALQIVLLLAARAIQRPTRTESLIAAAALVLLAADPGALVRPGFQLSFAGVSGILALRRPILARLTPLAGLRLGGRRAGRWLADGIATSAAATLATAPVVAWHFGQVPVVGLAANLVGIPILGATVPALALALAAGSVWLPAGRFLAGGGELLLAGLDATAGAAAAVPYGSLAVARADLLPWTAAVGAGWLLTRRLGPTRGPIRSAAWAGTTAAALLVAPVRPPAAGIEIHHIDVGQGDATAIRSPSGRWLLVDAGVATADYDAGAARVVPYLRARGVQALAGLVITHPDADHMGGARSVLTALRPSWAGGPATVVGKEPYLELLTLARRRDVPWVALEEGMELRLDGVRVRVLSPGRGPTPEDANDASLVVRIVYGDFEALLTGDAPADIERRLVRRFGDDLESDLLKVGHHGSATSTTAELIAATGARIAVISVGRSNRYGHPDAEVVRRLRRSRARVLRTDRDGTVVVRGRADGTWRVETERRSTK